jgi:hypothetical protein
MNIEQAIIEATRAYTTPLPTGSTYGARQENLQARKHRVVVRLRGEGFATFPVCGECADWRIQLAERGAHFLARNPRFVAVVAEIVGDDLNLDIEYREVGA